MLLREGFSNDEIRGACQPWDFIDSALQCEADRAILKICRSPQEVFERLEKWHDPENEVATQQHKFHEFVIPPHSNPIAAFHDLEDINNHMYEKGIGRIPDTVLHVRSFRALPDEYSLVKKTLQSMKNRDRGEIIRMVSTRYSNLLQKKGAQRSSRQPEHAFVSSECGDCSGARRGRGRGGSSSGGGGNSNSSRNSSSSTGGTHGSSGSGGSQSNSGRGGGSGCGRLHMPPGRCFRCRQRGHRREDCTTKESDFVPRCTRCTSFGREESSCSSDAAVLVVELPVSEEDLTVEAQTFVVTEAGKCSVTIGDVVGGRGVGQAGRAVYR